MSDQSAEGTLRTVTVSGIADLSDDEIATIVDEWERVQITDAETGEVFHDNL